MPIDSHALDIDGDGIDDSTELPLALAQPNIIELPIAGRSLVATDGSPLTVPVDVTAVSLNVTAVSPTTAGFITVWPCGVTRPLASNLNYVAGQMVANNVIAPTGSDGSICLFTSVDGADALPVGCGVDANQDNFMTILDITSHCEYDFWQARKSGNGWEASFGSAFEMDGTGVSHSFIQSRFRVCISRRCYLAG